MAQKLDPHVFSGLQQDIDPYKLASEFLVDARNIRISGKGNNTDMAITPELGTTELPVVMYNIEKIKGQYVGHYKMGEYLILFTHVQGNLGDAIDADGEIIPEQASLYNPYYGKFIDDNGEEWAVSLNTTTDVDGNTQITKINYIHTKLLTSTYIVEPYLNDSSAFKTFYSIKENIVDGKIVYYLSVPDLPYTLKEGEDTNSFLNKCKLFSTTFDSLYIKERVNVTLERLNLQLRNNSLGLFVFDINGNKVYDVKSLDNDYYKLVIPNTDTIVYRYHKINKTLDKKVTYGYIPFMLPDKYESGDYKYKAKQVEVGGVDRIYRFRRDTTEIKNETKLVYRVDLLYEGNLNLRATNPLKIQGVIKSPLEHRLYWIDGINPLRTINIFEDLKLRNAVIWDSETSVYLLRVRNHIYKEVTDGTAQSIFNVSQDMKLQEVGTVNYNPSGGVFPGGSVQYIATYISNNGKETNPFWISPVLYTGLNDRACKPGEYSTSSFAIKITNIDTTFRYIVLYSISRTSYEGTPIVKKIRTIDILENMLEASWDNTNLKKCSMVGYIESSLYGIANNSLPKYFKFLDTNACASLVYIGSQEINWPLKDNNSLYKVFIGANDLNGDYIKFINKVVYRLYARGVVTEYTFDLNSTDNANQSPGFFYLKEIDSPAYWTETNCFFRDGANENSLPITYYSSIITTDSPYVLSSNAPITILNEDTGEYVPLNTLEEVEINYMLGLNDFPVIPSNRFYKVIKTENTKNYKFIINGNRYSWNDDPNAKYIYISQEKEYINNEYLYIITLRKDVLINEETKVDYKPSEFEGIIIEDIDTSKKYYSYGISKDAILYRGEQSDRGTYNISTFTIPFDILEKDYPITDPLVQQSTYIKEDFRKFMYYTGYPSILQNPITNPIYASKEGPVFFNPLDSGVLDVQRDTYISMFRDMLSNTGYFSIEKDCTTDFFDNSVFNYSKRGILSARARYNQFRDTPSRVPIPLREFSQGWKFNSTTNVWEWQGSTLKSEKRGGISDSKIVSFRDTKVDVITLRSTKELQSKPNPELPGFAEILLADKAKQGNSIEYPSGLYVVGQADINAWVTGDFVDIVFRKIENTVVNENERIIESTIIPENAILYVEYEGVEYTLDYRALDYVWDADFIKNLPSAIKVEDGILSCPLNATIIIEDFKSKYREYYYVDTPKDYVKDNYRLKFKLATKPFEVLNTLEDQYHIYAGYTEVSQLTPNYYDEQNVLDSLFKTSEMEDAVYYGGNTLNPTLPTSNLFKYHNLHEGLRGNQNANSIYPDVYLEVNSYTRYEYDNHLIPELSPWYKDGEYEGIDLIENTAKSKQLAISNDSITKSSEYSKKSNFIVLNDFGNIGEEVSINNLLENKLSYIGGKDIQLFKNTLFMLGSYYVLPKLSNFRYYVIKKQSTKLKSIKANRTPVNNSNLLYKNVDKDSLESSALLKGNNTYRLGFQLQNNVGLWTPPYWLEDTTVSALDVGKIILENLDLSILKGLNYKKIRPMICFADKVEQRVVEQGLLCPTVYQPENRETNAPYAQSSWFFRPFQPHYNIWDYNPEDDYISNEIQGSTPSSSGTVTYRKESKIVTFHNAFLKDISLSDNLKLDLVKLVSLDEEYCSSEISCQTSTPPIGLYSTGFVGHKSKYNIRGGDGLYLDNSITANSEEFQPVPHSNMSYMVYPWHRNGSLNNDCNRPPKYGTRTAMLKKKIWANYTQFKANTPLSFNSYNILDGDVWRDTDGSLIRLKTSENGIKDKAYYGEVNTVALNDDGYPITLSSYEGTKRVLFHSIIPVLVPSSGRVNAPSQLFEGIQMSPINLESVPNHGINTDYVEGLLKSRDTIPIKYKSEPHIVLSLSSRLENTISSISSLYVADLIRTKPTFGGTSEAALRSNKWYIGGDSVNIEDFNYTVNLTWDRGDCFYEDHEILKTYEYAKEDQNTIVEIGRVKLASFKNGAGRYDNNTRGNNMLYVSPSNFNLFNDAYNQLDSLYSYYYTNLLEEENSIRAAQSIVWSRDTDLNVYTDNYQNIPSSNLLNLDIDNGDGAALNSNGQDLILWQTQGISKLLYKESTIINSENNGSLTLGATSPSSLTQQILYKNTGVEDYKYINSRSQNIYYIDILTKHLMCIDSSGQQIDISTKNCMVKWFRDNYNSIKGICYNNYMKDIIVFTNKESLVYSEILGQFVGIFDYAGIKTIIGEGDYEMAIVESAETIKKANTNNEAFLDRTNADVTKPYEDYITFWRMNSSDEVCNFFGKSYPYGIAFYSNVNAAKSKLFTNLSIRADWRNLDNLADGNGVYNNLFFDTIRVSNEYQDSDTVPIKISRGEASAIRKFRVWRMQLPRVNHVKDNTTNVYQGRRDRFYNPWIKIELTKELDKPNDEGELVAHKFPGIIHDLDVTYYD